MIPFNSTIEDILLKYKDTLGMDYEKYKNHVYRVYMFCLLIDGDKNNIEKYAIASAYHDIGIWTDHTFDYLNPSIRNVEEYLHSIHKADWIQEISLMIEMHHKILEFKSKVPLTIESFRKADWIDVTFGLLKFSLKKSDVRLIRKSLPDSGFHKFLLTIIFKNFMKHPLNPFPIFKL